MAIVTKINDLSEQISKGVHQFGTHVFKLALCSVAPAVTDTQLSDLIQIAYTNISGATAPTATIGISEDSGTTTVIGDKVVITATAIVPTFRYYVLYNDTATNKNLVCSWDHGSNVDLLNSEDTFSVKFNNTEPSGIIFTLAYRCI